jgi:hypothetical protein
VLLPIRLQLPRRPFDFGDIFRHVSGQLAADLARVPKMTLAELVELLTRTRGFTLDPETLWKITDTIAEEITNPSVRES